MSEQAPTKERPYIVNILTRSTSYQSPNEYEAERATVDCLSAEQYERLLRAPSKEGPYTVDLSITSPTPCQSPNKYTSDRVTVDCLNVKEYERLLRALKKERPCTVDMTTALVTVDCLNA